MSFMQHGKIACPNCGKPFEIEIWDSINSQISPTLLTKVFDGSLFRFKCPHCGEETMQLYPLLINVMTPEGGFVKLTSDPEGEAREIAGMFGNLDPQMAAIMERARPGRYRFVNSLQDLIEKVQLFRAGLDDRTIELMKLILKRVLEKRGETAEQARWFKDEDGKEYWATGNLQQPIFRPFRRKTYKYMDTGFRRSDPHWDDSNGSTYIVNEDWALDWLEKHP